MVGAASFHSVERMEDPCSRLVEGLCRGGSLAGRRQPWPIGEQGAQHPRPARRADALVVVIPWLGVVVVSCVLAGCVGPIFAHSHMDPSTVEDLRRQVPVYSESDVQGHRYVVLQPLSATACTHKLGDPAPTQEEAIDQLRVKAAGLGGNGVLYVVCEAPSGLNASTDCWASRTCHGAAIKVAP